MTDQLLTFFKFVLLGLLYLFFARVLWAVWSEVRTPVRPASGASTNARGKKIKRERGAPAFVVMEPRQRRGEMHPLSDVITIGRVDDNTMVIDDDSFISSHHARLEVRPDGVWLVDLQSTNGSFVNGQRVSQEKSLRKGDRIQVGSTVLEMVS
jgi:hypothetical protein